MPMQCLAGVHRPVARDEGGVCLLQGQGGGQKDVLRSRVAISLRSHRAAPRRPQHDTLFQQPPHVHQSRCEPEAGIFSSIFSCVFRL